MVRAIFARYAPSCVYHCFLELGSAPHAMNISPVSGLPVEHVRGYKHSFFSSRLTVAVRSFVVPEHVQEDPESGDLIEAA